MSPKDATTGDSGHQHTDLWKFCTWKAAGIASSDSMSFSSSEIVVDHVNLGMEEESHSRSGGPVVLLSVVSQHIGEICLIKQIVLS